MNDAKLNHIGDTSVFFQALAGFAIAALVAVGIGCTVYHLVAPGGWLAQLFARSLAGGLAALLAFMIVGLCAWLTRAWISVADRDAYAELFVYAFAGAGLLYAIEMLTRGGV